MTYRQELWITTLGLLASIVLCSTAMAQSERVAVASTSSACGTACSEAQMKRTASSSSRSLQASSEDLSALSSASKSNDQEQLRSILQKHGFSAAQLDGSAIVVVHQVASPRDAATGMATGKRMHKPAVCPNGACSSGAVACDKSVTSPPDQDCDGTADDAAARKITVTITISFKPPVITITIRA
jgi:hypothetical protein